MYDIINGQLDRSNAYETRRRPLRPVLEANPTVEVVIDLHRDGVAEGTHLVTEVDGKPTAKIMYFNGLSRTRTNGDIEYLYNPYIQDNLAFSLQMQLASESMYPGFARHIYLRGYRYNLHLMPKSLLIEAGAQTNTVEEMRNAMEVLAEQGQQKFRASGITHLLEHPEYRSLDKAKPLMAYLSEESDVPRLPATLDSGKNMNILIGPENVNDALKDTSVVMASYDIGDNMRGLIGVVGPPGWTMRRWPRGWPALRKA